MSITTRLRQYILAILAMLLPSAAFCQQYDFRNIGTEHGLPGNAVFSILQDARGYIWGSTDAGVFRYDGNAFKIFTIADGLPGNTVFKLQEDRHGRMWFTTYNQVGYFSDDHIYVVPASQSLSRQLAHGRWLIYSMYVDQADTVWLGTSQAMLYIPPAGGYTHFYKKTVFPEESAEFFLMQKDQHVLSSAAIEDGQKNTSLRVLAQTKTIRKLLPVPHAKNAGTTGISTCEVLMLLDGRLLFAYGQTLYIIHPGGQIREKVFENLILCLYQDPRGSLFIGLSHDGVWHYEQANLAASAVKLLAGNSIESFYTDHEHGLWAGSMENGLYYAPGQEIRNYHNIPWLNKSIIEVASIRDTVWGVTRSNEVFYIAPDATAVFAAQYPATYISELFRLHRINGGIYFSGIVSGSTRSGFRSAQFLRSPKNRLVLSTVDMVSDTPDRFQVLGRTTLMRVEQGRIVHMQPVPARGCCMEKDSSGNLYVGTLTGLYLYRNGNFEPVPHPYRNPGIRISDMAVTGSCLWLATYGRGVLVRNKEGTWVQLDEQQGLTSSFCNSVQPGANGDIWIGTNRGLNCIRPGKQNTFKIIRFDSGTGMPGNEVYRVATLGKQVWLATHKGLFVMSGSDQPDPQPPPPFYLSRLLVNDSLQADTSDEARYTHRQNNLTFYFDILSFKDPGKTRLHYRLKGPRELDRILTGNKLELSDLRSGDYTLSVYGMNSTSQSSSGRPFVYHFTVEHPFWARGWFIGVEVLTIFAGIWGILRFRLQKIRKREAEKAGISRQLIEQRMMALRAQMNPHFLFNAINGIQQYVLKKDTVQAYSYLTRFSQLVRMMLQHAQERLLLLADEIEMLKLYVELEQMRFEHSFDFHLDLDSRLDEQSMRIPGMLIQPFVENAIWHGIQPLENSRRGVIAVLICPDEEGIYIRITDNGIGRVSSARIRKSPGHQSVGISLSRQRIELMKKVEQHGRVDAGLQITDLYNAEGQATGTQVELWISG